MKITETETNNKTVEIKELVQHRRRKIGVKKKTLLALFLSVCMLSMSGCTGNDDSSSANNPMSDDAIDTTTDDEMGEVPVLAGVDYDEMFTGPNGERQKTNGKYATVTEDGLVRWDLEHRMYDLFPREIKGMKEITINGVSVMFPIKLEDITKLNEDYKELASLNCKKIIINRGMEDIQDEKSGYLIKGMGYGEYWDGKGITICVLKDDCKKLWFYLNLDKKVITRFGDWNNVGLYQDDVRVDGIGRGNTFNEMYEKFGTPNSIQEFHGVHVEYVYKDIENDKEYTITFANCDLMENPKSGMEEQVQKNMIQSVEIFVKEINKI